MRNIAGTAVKVLFNFMNKIVSINLHIGNNRKTILAVKCVGDVVSHNGANNKNGIIVLKSVK